MMTARLEKQPTGITAFLTRITGIQAFVEYRQKKQDQFRTAQHGEQTDALKRRHDREAQDMDRHYKALARLETRENQSVATAQRRERFRQRAAAGPTIKPEFARAAQGIDIRRGEGDSRAARKGQAARAFAAALAGKPPVTKGDLQAAFERATAGKGGSSGDADTKRPAPADPEKLEQARKLRDDLNRRQTRRGRYPDRDRDRER
jgi:hypothetical protein